MARAIKQLRQDLQVVDLAVELLDARIPLSSCNPQLRRLIEGKKQLLLLHKADRAEEQYTGDWLTFYRREGIKAIDFSVYDRQPLQKLLKYLQKQQQEITPKRFKRPLRMMFVGIPNVGKSTLINLFVKKAVVRTANRPGITRARQWIRITPGLELLDTPGILWPKISEKSSYPLAAVGTIPAGSYNLQETAQWLLELFHSRGKESSIINRYGIPGSVSDDMLAHIGKAQGFLLPAGKIDVERAAAMLLRDFQNGLLGRVTLEIPSE